MYRAMVHNFLSEIMDDIPCIYFRNVNNKTCPICREKLDSTDDSWVISEAPGSEEVNKELEKSLFNLGGGNTL
jgi:hypothetical protein